MTPKVTKSQTMVSKPQSKAGTTLSQNEISGMETSQTMIQDGEQKEEIVAMGDETGSRRPSRLSRASSVNKDGQHGDETSFAKTSSRAASRKSLRKTPSVEPDGIGSVAIGNEGGALSRSESRRSGAKSVPMATTQEAQVMEYKGYDTDTVISNDSFSSTNRPSFHRSKRKRFSKRHGQLSSLDGNVVKNITANLAVKLASSTDASNIDVDSLLLSSRSKGISSLSLSCFFLYLFFLLFRCIFSEILSLGVNYCQSLLDTARKASVVKWFGI